MTNAAEAANQAIGLREKLETWSPVFFMRIDKRARRRPSFRGRMGGKPALSLAATGNSPLAINQPLMQPSTQPPTQQHAATDTTTCSHRHNNMQPPTQPTTQPQTQPQMQPPTQPTM